MAPKCYICKFYDPKKMSLFRIPNRDDEYSERGRIWLKLLSAKIENINQIRICSIHFLKKKPSKADDFLDVDWVPNMNLGEYSKNWKSVEYYIRQKKASRLESSSNEQFNVNPMRGQSNATIVCTSKEQFQFSPMPGQSNATIKCESQEQLHVSPIHGQSNATAMAPYVYSNKCNFDATAAVSINKANVDAATSPIVKQDAKEGNFTLTYGEITGRLSLNSMIPLKKRKIMVTEERIFLVKDIQTELSMNDIDLLFEYYQRTVDERDELLLKLSTVLIDLNYFKDNDKKTRFFTGFTNWKLLNRFFDLVKDFIPSHFNCKLSKFQMLILTLMKLRLNSTFTDLGYRFQVDGTTASRTFHRCIYILFKKFKNTRIVYWPEENTLIFSTPSYFRSMFKDAVTIILDCFEIFIQRSSMLRAAAQAFSQYKHHATMKYLIGISMSGVIIFISKAFGGRTSDKQATKKSGILDKLKENDVVLADKGFLIRDEVNAKNAHLELPCFVKNGSQLHPTQVESSRKKSSLRIHVERVINVLRQKFNMCSDIAKMSAVAKQNEIFDRDLYDMILFVCSCIANICPSVVKSDFEI